MSYAPVYDKSHDVVPLVQQHQPQAQAGMMFQAGGSRNAKGKPVNSDGKRGWSNGICGCCSDGGTCLLACFCPCMVYSQNKSRLDHLEEQGRPHPGGGDNCTGNCALYTCLSCVGFHWVIQMMNRSEVRRRYRISGGCCGDCCNSFCCTCCALVQESRELELEEDTFGGQGHSH